MLELRATGQVIKFDGFLTLYQEGQDEATEDDEGAPPARDVRRRSAQQAGDQIARSISPSRRRASRKRRWSSAWKNSASAGPRPMPRSSQVLQDRGYVRIDKKRLIPEDKGRVVVAFLESFFTRYVEYDFTAGLEEKLDEISNSEIDWRAVLRDFWGDFIGAVDEIKELRNRVVLDALNELLGPHIFPPNAPMAYRAANARNCGTGQLSLKTGRFGAFIGCSNYPECKFTRQITPSADGVQGKKVLGEDPVTGLEVTLRGGRFGPYLQLGEQIKPPKPKKGEKKPKSRNPNAPASRKALCPTTSTSKRRSACCRCRAKSDVIRKTANRSSPASAASALTSSTARPMRTWKTAMRS